MEEVTIMAAEPSTPTGATRISFEDFVEAATRAVLRAMEVQTAGPRPEIEITGDPSSPAARTEVAAAPLAPPARPGRIVIGIIAEPRDLA
jgi:hypothetical protein